MAAFPKAVTEQPTEVAYGRKTLSWLMAHCQPSVAEKLGYKNGSGCAQGEASVLRSSRGAAGGLRVGGFPEGPPR